MRLRTQLSLALTFLLEIQFALAQILPSRATALERKVEVLIRARFDVPTACDIKVGARTPSPFTGYDNLHVTISQGAKNTDVEFLISTDNTFLARLEKFDLTHNAALDIDLRGRPIRGNPNAAVTVINFDDLECPVCARMHEILRSELPPNYGSRVRIIYKDNPLSDIHPWAMHAAVNAGCLAQQDASAYWSFVDYVHTHGQEVSGEDRNLSRSFSVLDRIATESAKLSPVDQNTLMACLKKQDETPVRQSMREAHGLGLNFTPALFVNGEEVRGLTSEDDPKRAIDRALRETEAARENQQPGSK